MGQSQDGQAHLTQQFKLQPFLKVQIPQYDSVDYFLRIIFFFMLNLHIFYELYCYLHYQMINVLNVSKVLLSKIIFFIN